LQNRQVEETDRMPRQNRVTPFGTIIATPERGTLMGNRGLLHDGDGQIRRDWRLKRWIHCVLEFNGRHRQVMTPGRYTELFFLDEATALAAGHRPCAECLRARYEEYRAAWAAGNPHCLPSERLSAEFIDDILHRDRINDDGSKRLIPAPLDELPDGVFVAGVDRPNEPFLIKGQTLLEWSPGGYRERVPREQGARVCLLTPLSTVEAIRAGFAPGLHETARPG
jgi:hypothetical protein